MNFLTKGENPDGPLKELSGPPVEKHCSK